VSGSEAAKRFLDKFPHLITLFVCDGIVGWEGTTQVLDIENALAHFHDKPESKASRNVAFVSTSRTRLTLWRTSY